MNTEVTPASATMDLTHFDVRVIPCRQKHALIFARWAVLPVGAHFVLVNDHDPVPLYYQFAAQFPAAFSWEYLVAGPDEFQVKITRLTASPDQPAIVPPFKGCGGASTDTEVDARGLEPPEPMMRILNAVETLKPGATLRARTDRRPVHLYPELDARGVRYVSEQAADESWITTLNRS
ncbi:MAG: DUF2249 domain-containing protein [Rariglobus sp.]|jgi:uncharacterized protein (DUF2249 family)|nr:DUF2249 domain-containing protein [Rariglobus sp.]